MKTNIKTMNHRAGGALCAGALLLMACGAQAQNLFVGNYYGGTISEFTPSGSASTYASGLTSDLNGLAFNSADDLFVAEGNANGGGNSIIEIITLGGTQSSYGFGFDNAVGLAFNTTGDLFVADEGNNEIMEVTPGGSESIFASGLDDPYFLAFNSAGNLFEADRGSGNIYEFTSGGTKSLYASLATPTGLAFNSAGDLFVGNGVPGTGGNITEITPGGQQRIFASGLDNPEGLAFNSAGNMFVADSVGNVTEITPSGQESTFTTDVNTPIGLAFAPAPEPSVLGLTAVGIGALFIRRHRRSQLLARRKSPSGPGAILS